MTTSKRWAIGLGSAGLVAGLALGVTGFAQAADPAPSPSAGTGMAPRIHGFGGPFGHRFGRFGGYGGLVTSVSGDTLTVRTLRGNETIALTGSTAYYRGQDKATKAAVKAGEVVRVRLVDPRASKPVAAVVTVVPAHVEGWVASIGSDTITVTDVSGFTRTIRTSDATTYAKDGTTSTRSALSVGTLIRATGRVDADGTTLDAARVAAGRPGIRDGDGPGSAAPSDLPPVPGEAGDGPTA